MTAEAVMTAETVKAVKATETAETTETAKATVTKSAAKKSKLPGFISQILILVPRNSLVCLEISNIQHL